MSDDLLRRMEKAVRRFGGPMAIDDLLPELEEESAVSLPSTVGDGSPEDPPRDSDGAPDNGAVPGDTD